MMNLHMLASWNASPAYPNIRRVSLADLKEALIKGRNDFLPTLDLFAEPLSLVSFGIILAAISASLLSGGLQLLFPLMAGFALIGPFAAIGLFEVSRRRELGLETKWADIFALRSSPALSPILTLGLGLMAIFIGWQVTANSLWVWLFGHTAPDSFRGLFTDVFATPHGWTLIILGNAIGFAFAAVVLGVSVVSFPLILDRQVGVAVAVDTSVRAMLVNPLTIAVWGLIVAASLVIGFLLAFLGVAFALPILAHANWHLYRRIVQ